MSKKAFKTYLATIPPEELSHQLQFLYEHFSEVKAYYNFGLEPRESYWMDKCKTLIYNEYFPATKRRRAKMRRSVIAKQQKQMELWGMDPVLCAELRVYHLEIALMYHAAHRKKVNEAFYKAVNRLFVELVQYALTHFILQEVQTTIEQLIARATEQNFATPVQWQSVYESLLLEKEKIK